MPSGARSTHCAPIDTLLTSLIDMSMRPVTSHRPVSTISAPTDSRGASSAVLAEVGRS
jgi:hypothetical protein